MLDAISANQRSKPVFSTAGAIFPAKAWTSEVPVQPDAFQPRFRGKEELAGQPTLESEAVEPKQFKPVDVPNPFYAYAHTHWDREWYRTFDEFRLRLVKVIDEVIDQVEKGTIPAFSLDEQSIVLDDYLELRPENRQRLKKLIQAGKISVGPWYVQPDEFLISGESLVRNLQRGVSMAKAFGKKNFTGYIPDSFGHAGDLPMILKQLGINTAIVWRGVANQYPWMNWQSPSGDKVLTYYLNDGYPQARFIMPHRTEAEKSEGLQAWLKKVLPMVGNDQDPIAYPVGCDHLGMSGDALQTLQKVAPKIKITTPDQFMKEAAQQVDQGKLKTLHGDLRSHDGEFLLPGVLSSRMYLKQQNKKLEWRLTRELEQLFVWQQQLGLNPQFRHELDMLWKKLLQNHPHDSICGCSVDSVHAENEHRFTVVDKASQVLVDDARLRIQQKLQPDGSILLMNLGDRPYTGVVEIERAYDTKRPIPKPAEHSQVLEEQEVNHHNPFLETLTFPNTGDRDLRRKSLIWAENIPAHGVLRLTSTQAPVNQVQWNGKQLGNGLISVSIDPANADLSIRDLKTGKIYSGLHQLWRNKEQGDGYNAAPVPGAPREKAKLLSVTPVTTGPLRTELKLQYLFSNIDLPVETIVTLDAGSPTLKFRTKINNNDPDHKIQAIFANDKPLTEVTSEGHFSPMTRQFDPAYRIEDHMPAPPGKELKVQTGPIQRWISWQDQTLATQGLTEYEAEGNNLKLTLLRSFSYMSRGDTKVRGEEGGPGAPTPDGTLIGRPMELEYSWSPGFEIDQAYQQADNLYGAVYGFDRNRELNADEHVAAAPVSFFNWDNKNIQASAMLPVRENVWQLRLNNPTALPQAVRLQMRKQPSRIDLIDLQGRKLKKLAGPTLTIAPFKLQTLELSY